MTGPSRIFVKPAAMGNARPLCGPIAILARLPPIDRFLPICLVLFAIILCAGVRYRLRAMPLERDEGEYAYAGQLLLQGIPPYQLAYTMKLPGTHAAYAVLLAAFGQTPSGIRLGLMLVNAATTLMVFYLAAQLFGTLAGAVAAASWALLSTAPSVLGFAAHATHFVVLAALAGILVLLRAIETKKRLLFFCSGLLLGVAFLMKQPGILFLVFAGVYLLKDKSDTKVSWRGIALDMTALASGGILPFVAICLIMVKAGLFNTFWFWTFSYSHQYVSQVSASEALVMFGVALYRVIRPAWAIWTLAALGLAALLFRCRARAANSFVSLLLLASFLAVCPGFYFRPHYFILALPAISILIGLAVNCATEKLRARQRSVILRAVPLLLFLTAFSYTVFVEREFLFQMDPCAACRSLYFSNTFPEAVDVADFITTHSSPEGRIAVLGSEPQIYFYSHRRSATGYIYTYGLVEEQRYAATMQREMIAEIESARPEYIVYVDNSRSWGTRQDSDLLIFAWAKTYLDENYAPVTVVPNDRSPDCKPQAISLDHPLPTPTMHLFKRRAS